MNESPILTKPGDVHIERLQLVSTRGLVVDLDDYFVEFNLYEEIFSPSLVGSILITDNRNLIQLMPIVGEELLIVKLTTPSFPSSIEKTFRVIKVEDKHIVKGQNAHMYTLHFISQELSLDMNAPIYKSFEGNIDDVVIEIFEDYVAMNRTLLEEQKKLVESPEDTPLKIITETKNKVKFVSPGWTAFKCINWLASRSLPKEEKACNFLFWESNKCYYFGTLETIFKRTIDEKKYAGVYTYSPSNIRTGPSRDIEREMFITDSVENITSFDYVKSYSSGYLSNRLVNLDIVNKKYENIVYDHVEKYHDYYHMSGKGTKLSMPMFASDSMRNPDNNIKFYPKHPKLFDEFEENINEKYHEIHGNRLSLLMELDSFKINISVPGRTDLEAGQMIYFKYPDINPKDGSDKNKENLDELYTGSYLISAIRHQVNAVRHRMILELTKDCLSGVNSGLS